MGEVSEEAVLGSSGCCLLSGTRARAAVLGTAELDVGNGGERGGKADGGG